MRFLELFAVRPNLLTRIENGIGAVQDGLLGNGDIPSGAQQFEVVLG